MKYVLVEKIRYSHNFDAYTKARRDILDILKRYGFEELLVEFVAGDRSSLISRFKRHFNVYKAFNNACKKLKKGDVLFIQCPEDNDCILFSLVLRKLKRRHIKTIALIHDLDIIRFGSEGYSKIGWIIKKYLENRKITSYYRLIVHNEKMIDVVSNTCNIDKSKIVPLDIFDYIYDISKLKNKVDFNLSVIIAGNLDVNKAGYLKDLPNGVQFELYGVGYKEENKPNINYNGKFTPEELPLNLKGGFGLVWDGETGDTCSGMFGKYLRINNPHKTSLYLASGIPVIIWEEAALADFIIKNNCGITIKSLSDIVDKIINISEEEYFNMRDNAKKIGHLLSDGYFTKKAVDKALED